MFGYLPCAKSDRQPRQRGKMASLLAQVPHDGPPVETKSAHGLQARYGGSLRAYSQITVHTDDFNKI